MLDSGFLELLAIGLEPEFFVKTQRTDLRIKADFAQSLRARLVDQRHQQCFANTLAAPLAQHGHPADLVFRRQSAGADRLVLGIAGDHVPALRVQVVPFLFLRNLLLDHEHRFANTAQVLEIDHVVGRFDAEIKFGKGVHSRVLEARFK